MTWALGIIATCTLCGYTIPVYLDNIEVVQDLMIAHVAGHGDRGDE